MPDRMASALHGTLAACGRVLAALCLCCMLGNPAWAGGIEVREVGFAISDEGYELDASVDIELTPVLENAVERGVPLSFRFEVEVSRSRWYWLDETAARRSQVVTLSYQSITRQYRVSTGPLQQNFSSLREAMRRVSRIRGFTVADRSSLRKGQAYDITFRYFLDQSLLPKPLQLSALTQSEWSLSAAEQRWKFTPGDGR